jgi:hypothetical protein
MFAAARRSSRRLAAVAVAVLLAAALLLPDTAARAESPTWAEVESAREDQAAAQALVARIEAELQQAQERSAATAGAALAAQSLAETARAEAEAATSRATALQTQADAALADFEQRRDELALVASALYRMQGGGPLVAQVLTSADPDALLDRLSLLDVLGSSWSARAAIAQGTARSVQSLSADARSAQEAREALAATAEAAAADARAAADAEALALDGLDEQADTLYAQLAALKNTTADLERRYRLDEQVTAQPANPAPPAGSGGSTGGGSTGGGSTGGEYGVVVDPAGAQAYARGALAGYSWGDDQFSCLVRLWNRESGWRADALNPYSGAYGIPQAYPADKMASAGADWRTNGATQVDWGLSYISGRYGSPCAAWDHSQRTGWY